MKTFLRCLVKSCLMRVYAILHPDDGGKVVYYHDVFDIVRYTEMGTPVALFRQHLKIAALKGYSFVSHIPTKPKQLMLCFDDGFHGIWDTREVFYSANLNPTVFLVVERVGTEGYLTWAEILELQQHGFIFQSHTYSHRHLDELAVADLPHELADARKVLSEKLGRDVTQLCYPCGLFSPAIFEQSLAAGYEACFTTIPGSSTAPLGIMFGNEILDRNAGKLIPRCCAQSATAGEFASILSGGDRVFKSRYMEVRFKR